MGMVPTFNLAIAKMKMLTPLGVVNNDHVLVLGGDKEGSTL